MTTVAELSSSLQKLMTTTAERIAKATGFIQRQREVTGAGFAQAVVFGNLAAGEATRKEVHASAIRAGLQVSVQGLDQRFNEAGVRFMRALLEEALTAMVSSEESRGMLPQFNGVYLTDCTRLTWTGLGMKAAVRLELQQGELRVQLHELNRHDQKTGVVDEAVPAGALQLEDLGFFKLERMRQRNAAGVYWLSRYKVGTTLTTLAGEPIDLKQLLTGETSISLPVLVGTRHPVRAILLAAPLTEEAFTKRLARLKEQARLDQRPLSQRQLELATWTIYLTNIPDLSFEQAFILARTRWQIELLFKLWKSHARVLSSRSALPFRQHIDGYAKLLGILISHWVLLVSGWQHDTLSPVDALRIIRSNLVLLQRAFIYAHYFEDFFHWLSLELQLAAPVSKRRSSPAAFQLWRDFDASVP